MHFPLTKDSDLSNFGLLSRSFIALFEHCLYCLNIQYKYELNNITLKNHDPVQYCCSRESSTRCSLRKHIQTDKTLAHDEKNRSYMCAANTQTITTQQSYLKQIT